MNHLLRSNPVANHGQSFSLYVLNLKRYTSKGRCELEIPETKAYFFGSLINIKFFYDFFMIKTKRKNSIFVSQVPLCSKIPTMACWVFLLPFLLFLLVNAFLSFTKQEIKVALEYAPQWFHFFFGKQEIS